MLRLHALVTPPRAPLLEGDHRLHLGKVILDSVVAEVYAWPDSFGQLWMVSLEDGVVVPSPPRMVGPVDDRTFRVDRQLCLDCVSFLLPGIVTDSLRLPLRPWNLLLRSIDERLEPGEVLLDLLGRARPLRPLVDLLRQWDALPDQWLEDTYVPAHVRLVDLEEELDQS